MRKSEDILFNLLRCELWGDKFDLDVTPQEIGEVLKVAKAQTVFGLVFNALVTNQVKLDKKVLFKAIAIQNKIRQQNELINQEMVDFFKQMDAHQMDYLVMKGQTLAVLYPHPEIRMSGDVDFLIKDDYEIVRKKFDSLFAILLPTLNAYEKEAAFERLCDMAGERYNFEKLGFVYPFKKENTHGKNIPLNNCRERTFLSLLHGIRKSPFPLR